MTIFVPQLKKQVIYPVLKRMGILGIDGVNLLLVTLAAESQMGYYLKQLGDGPALGIYQMEELTYNDIVNRYLRARPLLNEKLNKFKVKHLGFEQLAWNLAFATCMARVKYLMSPLPLPRWRKIKDKSKYIEDLANYHKICYNTVAGKATVDKTVEDASKYAIEYFDY